MSDSHKQRKVLLALTVFLAAFLLRLVLDLVFFFRFGWHSSHLIEIWFYYGVARGVFTLSTLDPTFLLLRVPGLLLPGAVLYQAVAFEAALISAVTAVLIFFWLDSWAGRETGFWGGVVFALLPAPLTLSLVNFSHDLVQVPLMVLFFWSTGTAIRGAKRPGRRAPAAFLAVLCLLLGLEIGPLMAGALVIVILYCLWYFFRLRLGGNPSLWAAALFLLGLLLLNYALFRIMKAHLLEWIAPLALKFRGIDLTAQVKIVVGDLQPLPRDAFWGRYTLFIFFLPWGFWTALKKKEFFGLSLFCFSMALALVVNRGARLLDLSVVMLTALGLAHWKKTAALVTVATVLLYLAIDLLFPGIAARLYVGLPYSLSQLWETIGRTLSDPVFRPNPVLLRCGWLFAGFFVVTIIWVLLPVWKRSRPAFALLLIIAFLQGGWVLLAARTSSDQVEYEAYRWLNDHSRPGEKIFASWNQGYFIEAVTHLVPITTPARIDLSLSRLYWEDEEDAARELIGRGVRYVHICTRYFSVTGVDQKNDTFNMRGSTSIGPRPDHIRRLSRMRRTFLFRLIYEPKKLRFFRPIYEKIDLEREVMVRFFEILPPEADQPMAENPKSHYGE
ncbi:MAG: hypothetical protein RAO92_10015 [Candidatus Euphemobacter frigidus]|nr:hypothetical protein [Candidatus Euphemobacter frigidus]MDP8276718.1 hypothetical protein [Candidatus Euphemobacter frigidus]